jgi:hypothetical protein
MVFFRVKFKNNKDLFASMKRVLIALIAFFLVFGCTAQQNVESTKSMAKAMHSLRLKAINDASQTQKQYEESSKKMVAEMEKKLSEAVTEEEKKEANDKLFTAKVLLEGNKELGVSVNFYKQEIEAIGKKIDSTKTKEEINDLIFLKENGLMYAFSTSLTLNSIATSKITADFSKEGAEINSVTSSAIENAKKLLQEDLSISQEEFERIVTAQGTEDIKKELEKIPEFKQEPEKAMKKTLSYGVGYFNKEVKDLKQRFQQELSKENNTAKELVLAQKILAVKQLKEKQ